jgi:hypothetical protein
MRVPLVTAYLTLVERLGNPEALSYRKQVCLQFLKWGVYAEDEDRDKFIEMALAWRKIENRRGGKRTIVEKRMRKLLRKWRMRKAMAPAWKAVSNHFQRLRREKRGVFDPEYKKTREREVNRANILRQIERGRHPSAKQWVVTEPDGTEVIIWNLQKYATEHGLCRANLSKTARTLRGTHKGYRARLVNNEWEGQEGG